MSIWKTLLTTCVLVGATACTHVGVVSGSTSAGVPSEVCVQGAEGPCGADIHDEGVGGGTVSLRIWALIAQGEFAEAQVLITDSVEAGLLSQTQAARMLERITLLNTRLGQIPASLQRVKDFPSQLRDYTLFQIKQLLENKDFTLATQAQLKLSEKLIEQQARLMEKI